MAAAALQPLAGWSIQQAEDFFDDPIAYFIRIARKLGVILLASGFLLGVLGYYLQAATTTAMNTEQQILGNIGNIFSNIKTPSFQPAATGTKPLSWSLQGVSNFFQDASQDVSALGSDLAQIGSVIGTLGEDVGIGLTDIGKAILAFVMHTPDLLWNGLVWGVGGAAAAIINFSFPYLIIVGGFLLIASLVAQGSRWAYRTFVQAGFRAAAAKWAERARAASERHWDRVFGNFQHPVAETVAPEPIVPVAAVVGQTSEEKAVGKAPPVEVLPPAEVPAPPEPVPPPVPPAPVVEATPNVVGPTPTVEVEEQLGGHQAIEPTAEELEAQEQARKETLPEPVEEEPTSDIDRQREILMAPLEA